jgi:hypothetical protein
LSISAGTSLRTIDVKSLQRELEAQGVNLGPNFRSSATRQ